GDADAVAKAKPPLASSQSVVTIEGPRAARERDQDEARLRLRPEVPEPCRLGDFDPGNEGIGERNVIRRGLHWHQPPYNRSRPPAVLLVNICAQMSGFNGNALRHLGNFSAISPHNALTYRIEDALTSSFLRYAKPIG